MAEYRGSLYIFVDQSDDNEREPSGYEAGDIFGGRNPGEMLWFMHGWAVGKSARSQYCARTSTSKLRCFDTFAQAMDFARKKRKNRPTESFHLVYEVDGQKAIVTSLEQIQQCDGRLIPLENGTLGEDGDHPELDALSRKVGKIVAMNALLLLRTLAQEGQEAAKVRFSAATYERLWQVLQEASLVEASV